MMYICRNCGMKYVTDNAVVCVNCQAPRGMGDRFCPFCGNQAAPNVHICQCCGVDMTDYGCPVSGKSKVAAGLLGIFLGSFGVHNFYLGYVKKGFIQLGCMAAGIVLTFFYMYSLLMYEINRTMSVYVVFFFYAAMAVMAGIRIWTFVESIMILCGKNSRDGKEMLLRS